MKKGAFNLNSFIAKIGNSYFTGAETKDFVTDKYSSLSLRTSVSQNMLGEFQILNDNLITLGWIEKTDAVHKKKFQEGKFVSNAIEWINDLKDGKVINNGIIVTDSGVNLDMLDEIGEDLTGLTFKSIETLLKFVEVKRQKALKAFSQDFSPEKRMQAGLEISILFSRVARRHSDMRFLNAALKLDDWYYQYFKSAHDEKSLIYLLIALTEQEISATELLQ
jgi:hypothetical protein